MVNLISEVRNVDTSIRLSRDVKLVLLILRPQPKPLNDGLQVIGSYIVIIPDALICIFSWVAVRVPDTSWLFDIEHVDFSVPGIFILSEFGFGTFDDIWAVLLDHTSH